MIAPLWLVTSLAGRRALAVPLASCGPCGMRLPADHTCPAQKTAPDAPGAATNTHTTTRESEES